MSVPHPSETFPLDPARIPISRAVTPADGAGGARPLSASLARRLAAAADGHRDGCEIFFQARYLPDADGDYEVTGPFTREKVGELQAPPGFGIFGPFCTPKCDDDISCTPIQHITLHLRNGQTITFAGDRYDALFWSSSALEKFVVPYYAVIGGVRRAERLLDQFLTPEVFMIAHDPNTEETLVKIQPEPGSELSPATGG